MVALLDRETRVRRQVGELPRRTVPREVFRRRAQYPMIRREPFGDQMRRDFVAGDYLPAPIGRAG